MSRAQAKQLRTNMTDAERRLWYRLRAHRFDGHKFKRQVPVGPYIVDFACLARKLVVEVDGGQHNENSGDVIRDRYLERDGLRVLRFWNNDVLRNTDGVFEIILGALKVPSPGALRAPPSPASGRGESGA